MRMLLLLSLRAFCTGSMTLLDELAGRHGTDKGSKFHGYTRLYSMLLEDRRMQVRNMTEVGVFTGSSAAMWLEYFPTATFWGIESKKIDAGPASITRGPAAIRKRLNMAGRGRWHILYSSSTCGPCLAEKGMAPGSQDVIVEDGNHDVDSQADTLVALWPFLRMGGLYFVEDVSVGTGGREKFRTVHNDRGGHDPVMRGLGSTPLVHDPSFGSPAFQQILHNNDVFFADTMVNHPNASVTWTASQWEAEAAATHRAYRIPGDRVNHNSHVLVIRKRSI